MDESFNIDVACIKDAAEKLHDHLFPTPLITSTDLSHRLKTEVSLKLESLQPAGTLKQRGFAYRLLTATHAEKERGFVTAPNINAALALAHEGRRQRMPVSVYLPNKTFTNHIEELESLGAKVLLKGEGADEVLHAAEDGSAKEGLTLLHPTEDAKIITGDATVAVETFEQISQPVDFVLAPVMTGSTLTATARAFKTFWPQTQLIGVEPESYPQLFHHMKGKNRSQSHLLPDANLLSAMNRMPMTRWVERNAPQIIDDVVTVSDESVNQAILYLLEVGKLLVAVDAATPIAALFQHQSRFSGKRVLVLLCGGNLEINLLTRIVDRGLFQSGRLSRMNVLLSDEPGQLERLSHLFAEQHANILAVSHDRIFNRTPLGSATCHLTVETKGRQHVTQLMRALEDQGYSFTISQ